ncbi:MULTISPECIES: M3 family oligoendopeptidase [Bacillus]|uniref:M3 family oligoendopeptidase n=1 Tax=Bacillus TaxID=1386 RepID=UPI000BFA9327|nr:MULTISPECIES: M3 family oligoendopeptidase [Bacillus]MDF9666330.1 M3 family oligoendopeptidase [Bacillus wiedmannii]PFZ26206.1 peptidase M3 [Bacillus wiedmannii]PGC20004.1 peptidase M3 [Bacillus wiedmannii]PGC59150.1 peptidase M3 [Bacillus wiedmannii]PHE73037.1 peptidase M3 [Bacillus wiedmannii]
MLNDLESKLQSLLERNITSVSELENWLLDEQSVTAEIEEEITSSLIATYRDTNDRNKRNLHMYNQNTIQPLLKRYNAKFDQKFIESPFSDLLDEQKYSFMKKARLIKSKMFNDKNIALTIKEQELITQYREIMSNISINWEGELKTYAYIKAKLDNPNRVIREKAWYALFEARSIVKIEIDCIMNELIQLRNEIALHAGFNNYSEYAFKQKNRDYCIAECYKLHESIEKYVVPIWEQLGSLSKKNLGVKKYRPWDLTPSNLPKTPFQNAIDLLNGVEEIFRKTDLYFYEKFIYIRKAGFIDVEERENKAPGAACFTLPHSKEVFVYSNFSPSFYAINALIHEVGHAFHFYKQFNNDSSMQEKYLREEVAELYSLSLELLVMDKLDIFYKQEDEYKEVQRVQLYRAFSLLMSSIAGDVFQHWLYSNPNHTPGERDKKYMELCERYQYSSVDIAGLEDEISSSWLESFHFIQFPFYKIEYAIAQIGAMQLFQIYREDPEKAIAFFKEGASADWNLSIQEIYEKTGITFDFSEERIESTASVIFDLINELK